MKKKKVLEKVIEKKVCDYAKRNGIYTRKFTSPARRSVPDHLFLYNGVCFFIEFKAEGKKPTVKQTREIKLIRECKIDCYVVDNINDGTFIIDLYL